LQNEQQHDEHKSKGMCGAHRMKTDYFLVAAMFLLLLAGHSQNESGRVLRG
jgi:hypothetical protein